MNYLYTGRSFINCVLKIETNWFYVLQQLIFVQQVTKHAKSEKTHTKQIAVVKNQLNVIYKY